jgi:shikimate kinase
MSSIILVGPRCTGKTEKGEILAEIRHVPFVDADKVFEKRYSNTIKKFVEELGWKEFRRCETDTLFRIFQNYILKTLF